MNSHTTYIATASKPSHRGARFSGDYDEFLAQAETEIDAEAFHETVLARFAAFDLQFLLTGHRYYVYSEDLDAVSPAEFCCHSLLIDNGSRQCSYCFLLLSHVDVDWEDLRDQASKYVSKTKSTPCSVTSRRRGRSTTGVCRSGTSSRS